MDDLNVDDVLSEVEAGLGIGSHVDRLSSILPPRVTRYWREHGKLRAYFAKIDDQIIQVANCRAFFNASLDFLDRFNQDIPALASSHHDLDWRSLAHDENILIELILKCLDSIKDIKAPHECPPVERFLLDFEQGFWRFASYACIPQERKRYALLTGALYWFDLNELQEGIKASERVSDNVALILERIHKTAIQAAAMLGALSIFSYEARIQDSAYDWAWFDEQLPVLQSQAAGILDVKIGTIRIDMKDMEMRGVTTEMLRLLMQEIKAGTISTDQISDATNADTFAQFIKNLWESHQH